MIAINNGLIESRSEGYVDKLFKKYIEVPKRCNKDETTDAFEELDDIDNIDNDKQVNWDDLSVIWILMFFTWIVTICWRCIVP